MPYRAMIVGATGAVGGALVRQLLASRLCDGVVALTRRPLDPAQGRPFDVRSDKLRVHVIDLANLEHDARELGAGCEAAFCTMGVGQPRKVSFEEFWRVDVEYAHAFARGAATAGARHFSLLSAVGVNPASRNRYFRVKGTGERRVSSVGIPRVSLFRPSILVTREIRYGLQDRLTQALFPLVQPLLPQRYHAIRVEDLARAMRINAERPGKPGLEILEYPDFAALLQT